MDSRETVLLLYMYVSLDKIQILIRTDRRSTKAANKSVMLQCTKHLSITDMQYAAHMHITIMYDFVLKASILIIHFICSFLFNFLHVCIYWL